MIQLTSHMRILVAVEPADFRKGIDGLAAVCRGLLGQDPFGGVLFVFRNRYKRQAKRRGASKQCLVQVKATKPVPKTPPPCATEPTEVSIHQLRAIIERAGQEPLNPHDCQLLLSVSETLALLTEQLEHKNISIGRLRKLLFGASTETLDKLVQTAPVTAPEDHEDIPELSQEPQEPSDTKPKPSPGHGRNGAETYTGAQKVNIDHETLHPGDLCPDCLSGTVYETSQPGHVVRVTGQAPLQATVYEVQKLRCGLCGKVFTPAAAGALGPEKYDAAAVAMIALLKYGTGVPFHRLQRLQETLGIPLAASTQWETLSRQERVFYTVYRTFIRQAAQGRIVHNDDTTMRILDRTDLKRPDDPTRKGIFTSGRRHVHELDPHL